MAASGGIWAPAAMAFLRIAVRQSAKMSNMVRSKISNAARQVNAELYQLQPARNPRPQPIHPAAFLRQQHSRRGVGSSARYYNHLAATARRWLSHASGGAHGPNGGRAIDRTLFPSSNVSRALTRLPGHARAPFHTTLRPNLTGGALPRTQGGYAYPSGGGARRLFSHVPAQPAQQVAAQVGQACRAFWLGGKRARFDGVDEHGRARFRAVSAEHDGAVRKMKKMSGSKKMHGGPGAFVDFRLAPTLTALSPLAAGFPFGAAAAKARDNVPASLNAEGFLDGLSRDFRRALKDIDATMADVQRLASLGDLPVQLLDRGHTLRVRFPGLDADAVERLCDDVGVRRGLVGQDEEFERDVGVEMALRFPFAPEGEVEKVEGTKVLTSPGGSLRSLEGTELQEAFLHEFGDELEENHWLSSSDEEVQRASPKRYGGKGGDGYESMSPPVPNSEDFEGLEGIYRFLEECDRAKVSL